MSLLDLSQYYLPTCSNKRIQVRAGRTPSDTVASTRLLKCGPKHLHTTLSEVLPISVLVFPESRMVCPRLSPLVNNYMTPFVIS